MTSRAIRRAQQVRQDRLDAQPLYADIGARLRIARLAAGLTITTAAARIGVGRNHLGHWEHGKGTIPPHRLAQLAALYQVSILELTPDPIDDLPVAYQLTASPAQLAALRELAAQGGSDGEAV